MKKTKEKASDHYYEEYAQIMNVPLAKCCENRTHRDTTGPRAPLGPSRKPRPE